MLTNLKKRLEELESNLKNTQQIAINLTNELRQTEQIMLQQSGAIIVLKEEIEKEEKIRVKKDSVGAGVVEHKKMDGVKK